MKIVLAKTGPVTIVLGMSVPVTTGHAKTGHARHISGMIGHAIPSRVTHSATYSSNNLAKTVLARNSHVKAVLENHVFAAIMAKTAAIVPRLPQYRPIRNQRLYRKMLPRLR